MAERIEMPLTPDISEPKDGSFLIGTPITSSGGEKILPHYLRASTGSCHDLCKYGGEHAFGAKEKRAILKARKTTVSEGQSPKRTVSLKMRKKKPLVKSTPPARTWSCDVPEISVRERKFVNLKALSPVSMRIDSVVESSLPFKPKPKAEKSPSHLKLSRSCDEPEISKRESKLVTFLPTVKIDNVKQSSLRSKPTSETTNSPSSELKLSRSCDEPEISKRERKAVRRKTLSPVSKRNSVGESSLTFKPKRETTKSSSSKLHLSRSCDEPEISKRERKVVKQKALSPAAKRINSGMESSLPVNPKRETAKSSSSQLNFSRSFDEPEISKRESKVVKKKALSPATKKMNSSVESPILFEPKRVTDKSASSQSNSSRIQSGRTGTDVKTGKNNETSKIGQKKILVLPKGTSPPKPYFNKSASLKKRMVLKGVSPPKNKSPVKKDESSLPIDENINEKTLYVIEPKCESKSLELDSTEDEARVSLPSPSPLTSSSPHSPLLTLQEEEEYIESEYDETADSEYEETETDSEYDETENQNQLETLEKKCKRGPRRGATIHPEGNDPAHKLNFRRGKMVDLQSENNAPRRLKFRKRRVFGVNQNGKDEARGRNFRKKEVNDCDYSAEPESEKVVLRHQDVNGRKDTQGLFNNVIEETVSKLAETRKSKVKALVGAFETVISLQESKTSANNFG